MLWLIRIGARRHASNGPTRSDDGGVEWAAPDNAKSLLLLMLLLLMLLLASLLRPPALDGAANCAYTRSTFAYAARRDANEDADVALLLLFC